MGDLVVFVTIKLNNLGVPLAVVDVSPSDLDSDTFPSWDVVEDSPGVSDVRLLEVAIDDDVGVGSVSLEDDVVDGEAVAVFNTGSFDLELVLSGLDVHHDGLGLDVVVRRNNGGDDDIVPENVAHAGLEVDILSAGPGEGELEFVGQRRLRSGR